MAGQDVSAPRRLYRLRRLCDKAASRYAAQSPDHGEDDSQIDLGTTLCKISPTGVFAWKSYGLVEEKTVPFLPNTTGMAFVVIHPRFKLIRSSWRGRGLIETTPEKPRFSLLNAYYAKPVTEAVY
jgi:hypothetical protein